MLRAPVYIAINILILANDNGMISIADIAKKMRLSRSYIEQMTGQLSASGIMIGRRGPGGGIQLIKSLEKISVYDVAVAISQVGEASRGLIKILSATKISDL